MPRPHLRFARLLFPLLGLLALLLAGCMENDRVKTAAEIDEPAYREGQALLKTGRRQEALAAFLKVIDKRGEDAPESHLEIGLLYAQHINDPLSAIYHFKKYLAIRPNSPLASVVRQRIDAATREFARTLPAQPLENQLQRVDLVATLDKLKQENEALKQELADTKAGRNAVAMPALDASPAPVAPTASVAAPVFSPPLTFSLETVPSVRTGAPAPTATRPVTPPPAPARQATATPTRPTPTPAVTAPVKPATSSRVHTVQPGDTLSSLSQKYYGNRTRWRDIYAANRGVMKSETDLKAGVKLKIP